jgi:apolipoprotein D and lipocalin family protein
MSVTDFFAGIHKCDHPAALTNFDGARYMGTWYEQQHIKGQFFQADDTVCTTAEYSNLQPTGHFVVNNTYQDADFGQRKGIIGDGYCPDASGQCFVTFYVTPSHTNYQVVDTDYDSYSIVYACGFTKSFLWLLTREAVVSDELYNKMVGIAKANLPTFDFSTLNTRDYQGPKCTYNANYFLQ